MNTIAAVNGHSLLMPHAPFVEALLASYQFAAVYDKHLRLVAINDASLASTKQSRDEVLGKSFEEIFPTLLGSQALKDLKRALGGEHIANNNYHSSRLDRYFQNYVVPLKDENGDVQGVLVTGHDITDLVKSAQKLSTLNEQLAKKNKEFEEAQRLSHIGSWEWDIKKNKITWTDELYRIYGVDADKFEATYENFVALVHPADREMVNSIIQRAYQLHHPFNFQHRILRPDGQIKVMHGRGEVGLNEAGEPTVMRGTGQDITERVEAEDQLRQLNLVHNFAEQKALMGSFSYHFSSDTYTYSDNLYRLMGFEPSDFTPGPEAFFKLVHPDDIPQLEQWFKQLLDTHELNSDLQYRLIRKGGEIIHVKTNGITIGHEDDQVFIGAIQDITWQYNKEQQLIQQNYALESANKELAAFSYVSSHDLQEPLRKIMMFAKRIMEKEYANLSSEGRIEFQKIDNAASRMKQLIEDLLSYSRTSIEEKHFEEVDAKQLLAEVVDELQEEIEEAEAEIATDHLPVMRGIPFQLRQLFSNLLTNSLKFAREAEPLKITIRYSVIDTNKAGQIPRLDNRRYHHIIFSDNGIGFEPEFNDRIFGLFQKLHARSEYEGTGIGLSICKKIVENHHGSITAEGRPGAGVSFHIYLPAE